MFVFIWLIDSIFYGKDLSRYCKMRFPDNM